MTAVTAQARMLAARQAERAWRKEVEACLRAAGVLRTLADMTEVQIVALEQQYGCKVKRPGGEK